MGNSSCVLSNNATSIEINGKKRSCSAQAVLISKELRCFVIMEIQSFIIEHKRFPMPRQKAQKASDYQKTNKLLCQQNCFISLTENIRAPSKSILQT